MGSVTTLFGLSFRLCQFGKDKGNLLVGVGLQLNCTRNNFKRPKTSLNYAATWFCRLRKSSRTNSSPKRIDKPSNFAIEEPFGDFRSLSLWEQGCGKSVKFSKSRNAPGGRKPKSPDFADLPIPREQSATY